VASAQKHLRDRGLNADNYVVPIGFRAQIQQIFHFFANREATRQQNRQISLERVNALTVRLRNFVEEHVPEAVRTDWNQVDIVLRNNNYFAICPECLDPISVFDSSGSYFRSFNFNRHVLNHVNHEEP